MLSQVAMPNVTTISGEGSWLREEAQIMMSEVRPLFSTELVIFLSELAYSALRRRMRRSVGNVEMLDCMYMLLIYAVVTKGGRTTEGNNRHAAELIGRISQHLDFPPVFNDEDGG